MVLAAVVRLRMKRKKLKLSMADHLSFKSPAETRHWRYCDGCGRRFSERDMVWIDIQGWLCGKCQRKIA